MHDEDRDATETRRLLYRAWAPTEVPDTHEPPPRQRSRARSSAGPWIAAAPMLLLLALIVGGALVVGASVKATTALSRPKASAVAGAEQMRRQAQAVQAFKAAERIAGQEARN